MANIFAAEGALAGKVAVVTGASSGLGAHFAEVLALAGAEVLAVARRQDALAYVAKRITDNGGRCRPVAVDVTDHVAFETKLAEFPAVDILVNNAGTARDADVLDIRYDDWAQIIDLNLTAVFTTSQLIARAMAARGKAGSIINIASIAGLRQLGRVLPYATSKAGVVQLTKAMALELARHGVRVNAIAPGYFETDLNHEVFSSEKGKAIIKRIPQRRLGHLNELDGPLLLLASDASSYMTGSILTVDGGHLVSTL
ncbi:MULTISPECIES: SDR family NAD(P)-dependent oxidoreductase [Sphingobium]|uniref:SDR family NAD(P)-dependent oxidoreductase n=1 Tax=Sphingobium sp. TA15 TaxID=2905832 RepID=UPI000674D6FC|nr:SDR family NAD(P)-dependent oxidoreductase [Sphingobium indicum]